MAPWNECFEQLYVADHLSGQLSTAGLQVVTLIYPQMEPHCLMIRLERLW